MSRKLAIHGGQPVFDRPRHVGEPNIADQSEFLRRVAELLESQRFTNNGPFVHELEKAVATRLGVKECVAVANATLGIQLVLAALGRTGNVIVPAWTFVATPHAARMQGLDVRFVDVNPATHTVDTNHLNRLVDADTAALIAVHLFGQPCDVAAIEQITKPLGVPVLFDAAHVLGVKAGGRYIGGDGVAEIFSLHATKFVHGFEGGLVTTNDPSMAAELRLLRNFGFGGRDRVERLGTNAKLSEIHAAMALTQFGAIDELRAVNAERHEAYGEGIDAVPGLEVFQPTADTRNDQYVVVDVDPVLAKISRDRLVAVLEAEGVLARSYFAPGCHRHMPYVLEQPGAGRWLPATERLAERTLVLPTGPNLSMGDVRQIAEILDRAVQESRAGRRASELTVSA